MKDGKKAIAVLTGLVILTSIIDVMAADQTGLKMRQPRNTDKDAR